MKCNIYAYLFEDTFTPPRLYILSRKNSATCNNTNILPIYDKCIYIYMTMCVGVCFHITCFSLYASPSTYLLISSNVCAQEWEFYIHASSKFSGSMSVLYRYDVAPIWSRFFQITTGIKFFSLN